MLKFKIQVKKAYKLLTYLLESIFTTKREKELNILFDELRENTTLKKEYIHNRDKLILEKGLDSKQDDKILSKKIIGEMLLISNIESLIADISMFQFIRNVLYLVVILKILGH